MSDERLRGLRRAAEASGDPADEAAWVQGLARAGRAEQVAIAAALGHAPALAVSAPAPDPVAALERLGPAAVVRALLAIAARREPKWLRKVGRGGRAKGAANGLARAWEAARAWVLAPSAEAAASARRAAVSAERTPQGGPGVWATIQAAYVAGGEGLTHLPPAPGDGPHITNALVEAARADTLARHLGGPRSRLADAAEQVAWSELAPSLVPWLLGQADPLA